MERPAQQTTLFDRSIPLVLLFAFLLHSAEEAVTYGTFRPASQALLRSIFSPAYTAPTVTEFHVALALVSIFAAVLMLWAWGNAPRRAARNLQRVLAWIMLANVLIPHIPAAVLMGGYAPGVLTAMLVNLPAAGWALIRMRQQPS